MQAFTLARFFWYREIALTAFWFSTTTLTSILSSLASTAAIHFSFAVGPSISLLVLQERRHGGPWSPWLYIALRSSKHHAEAKSEQPWDEPSCWSEQAAGGCSCCDPSTSPDTARLAWRLLPIDGEMVLRCRCTKALLFFWKINLITATLFPKRKRLFLNKDSKDPKPLPAPKKDVAFSTQDSRTIETAFEHLVDRVNNGTLPEYHESSFQTGPMQNTSINDSTYTEKVAWLRFLWMRTSSWMLMSRRENLLLRIGWVPYMMLDAAPGSIKRVLPYGLLTRI